MRLGEHLVAIAASVQALDATADILTLYPIAPIRVVRWGTMVSVALDNTPNVLAASLDHTTHDEDGTATRAADAGTTTLTAAATDQVVGTIIYVEPTTEIICRPGDILHWEVTTAASAGDGFPFIEYQQMGFVVEGRTALFSDNATNRTYDGST